MKARIPLADVIEAALNNKLSLALQRILYDPDKWTVVLTEEKRQKNTRK